MKRMIIFLLMLGNVTFMQAQYTPRFDLQGHRGARGVKPENTIPSFIAALQYGVTTIELDVVISADRQVVVSHEPWLSSGICLKPDGSSIEKSEEMSLNMYEFTYEQIKQYDCGSKGNAAFPEQQAMPVAKPLLRDVIVAVEDYIKSYTQYEVDYNIEIKSQPEGDNKYHPDPATFSELVYNLIDQYLPWNRVVIQSFDMRVLKYWHEKYPHVRLAFLVMNNKSAEANLKELGFHPAVYSPYFKQLTKDQVNYIHLQTSVRQPEKVAGADNKPISTKMRVIPWTVNEKEDMKRLKDWGVDGLITDYPNRAAEIGLALKRPGNPEKTNRK